MPRLMMLLTFGISYGSYLGEIVKKIFGLGLLAVTFFASNAYSQDLILSEIETSISSDLIQHLETFISDQANEMTFQLGESGEETVERRQLLREVEEFRDLVRELSNRDQRRIKDLKGDTKARFKYLLYRAIEINNAMGQDKMHEFLDFAAIKELSPIQSAEMEKLADVMEIDPAEADLKTRMYIFEHIKLSDVAESYGEILNLRNLLSQYSTLDSSLLGAGKTKLLIQYRGAVRRALLQSLFMKLPKLDETQQLKLMENLLNGTGDIKTVLFGEIRQHLEEINLIDLDANDVYKKFEFIIRSETADIIELAELHIPTEGIRREKSKWRELMRADLAQFKGGSTETPSARLSRVLKFALKMK